ncbi:hypothetical protein GCM10023191_000490 [Actinoallomurus oryzae]|uniref:Uncharacterized protein n=1 Tax=Actinoallomurus oryzae TaxID=502180 RepID=A0ABP8P6D0_9ACTN
MRRILSIALAVALESYLDLPRWYGARHGGDAAKELTTQLSLIAASVSRTAGEIYASEERRMRDHTRYLRDRDTEPPPV